MGYPFKMMHSTILAIIAAVEVANGIPQGILYSVCKVESNLNPVALVEYDGDGTHSVGLCQMKVKTAQLFDKRITQKDLLNPRVNAKLAGKYLKANYIRYGSWSKAVIAYNKGHADTYQNSYLTKVIYEWTQYDHDVLSRP